MDKPFKPIIKLALEFFLLAICLALIPAIASYDILVLENGLKETSVTEFLHSFMAGAIAVTFLFRYFAHPQEKGLNIAFTGFFTILLIRENDFILDEVTHGFWAYPAAFVAIVTIYIINKYRLTTIEPFLKLSHHKAFSFMFLGLAILIIFSRIFGTGSFWQDIMQDDYQYLYKTIIQECLESVGYLFILFGSVKYYFATSPRKQ